MPNIIEQQNLLKGLPDESLSTLMQNPTGDIPPFLVAAEAQRRQSIREQFSGGPQESVVDTLTKQMANVPQNIQAPSQQPPQMPPPDMGGVAALQGEQQMRDGGYVQRYQYGGKVEPWWEIPNYGESIPGIADYATSILGDVYESATQPYTEMYRPETEPRDAVFTRAYPQVPSGSASGMSFTPNISAAAPATIPNTVPTPETDPGKEPTSDENKLKEYEAQLRAIGQIGSGDSAYIKGKLQELYGDNEASDWEKAQKWFAAAQAAIEPGQNNWQAAVNALSAFGGGMAEERAAERAGDRELAEALLKYEIADRQYRTETERDIAKDMMNYRISLAEAERDADAARKAEQLGAYEFYTKGASGNIEAANLSIRSIMAERQEYIKSLPKDEITGEPKIDPADPTLRAYDEQIKSYRDMISGAMAQREKALQGYGRITNTDPSVTVFTGDGLSTYNR